MLTSRLEHGLMIKSPFPVYHVLAPVWFGGGVSHTYLFKQTQFTLSGFFLFGFFTFFFFLCNAKNVKLKESALTLVLQHSSFQLASAPWVSCHLNFCLEEDRFVALFLVIHLWNKVDLGPHVYLEV